MFCARGRPVCLRGPLCCGAGDDSAAQADARARGGGTDRHSAAIIMIITIITIIIIIVLIYNRIE